MERNNTKHLAGKYTFLHINYWGIYSALLGFTAVYMMSLGMSASQIGFAMACSSICSTLIQPPLATFADSTRKYTIKRITLFLAIIGISFVIGVNFLPVGNSAKVVMFVGAMASTNIMLPMLNSINVYYTNRGEYINYGASRGIGSFSYAVVSYILGYAVRIYGENIITLSAFILYILLIVSIMQFRMKKDKKDLYEQRYETTTEENHISESGNIENKKGDISSASNNIDKRNFFVRHRRYMFLLCGVVFSFAFHNMTNTYMIQIVEYLGGNSRDMGISVALAAALELPTMFFFSKIVEKIDSAKLMKIAGLSFFIKSILFFMADSVYIIYVSQIMQMFSFALFIPASVYYANIIMDERDKVKGQTFMTTSFTISGVVGNLLGGYLIDNIGVHNMMAVSVISAFIGMVIVFIAAGGRDFYEKNVSVKSS